jgi:hypothetical protein
MKAKIVLTQSMPFAMAKVILGHLEYEVEQEMLEKLIKEYNWDHANMTNAVNAWSESKLLTSHKWLCDEVERLSQLDDPRQELRNLVVYLNTPIAVA